MKREIFDMDIGDFPLHLPSSDGRNRCRLVIHQSQILGKLIVGLIGLLMFFVVLPTVVSFAVDNISLFEGLRSPGDQPIEEVLRRLLDFTN